MKLTKTILCAVAVAAAFSSAAAQEVPAASASTAMQFLNVGASPKTWGSAGVRLGLALDEYAYFNDIAAVPFGGRTLAAGVSYGMWQPSALNATSVAAAASWNLNDRWGVALGAQTLLGKSYETVSDLGVPSGTFTPNDLRVGAGVAYRVIDNLSVGVTLNYARSSIAPSDEQYKGTMNSFFADVQVMYVVGDFDISLSASNLGSGVKSASGQNFSLPMNAKVGAGYAHEFGKHGIAAGVEGGMYFAAPAAAFASLGAEYSYGGFVALRAGYHYGSQSNGLPSFASVGLGFRFLGVNIDAAYLIAAGDSPLRNTIAVGLGYSF